MDGHGYNSNAHEPEPEHNILTTRSAPCKKVLNPQMRTTKTRIADPTGEPIRR